MDVEMKSKNYTYFSERSYTGKDCKIDDKVVDYWKKVLGDNVFNNIEKVYNLRPEIVMSKKDFENVTESKEILQFSPYPILLLCISQKFSVPNGFLRDWVQECICLFCRSQKQNSEQYLAPC